MWTNLEAIHQLRGYQTQAQLMCELYELKTHEGDNIPEHLAKVMQLWNHIKQVCSGQKMKKEVKDTITYLMPYTWDDFVCPYIIQLDMKNISVHGFIGECNEEY